jgi:alkylation response protein AidB-like acyl-CoA dehydrogenase
MTVPAPAFTPADEHDSLRRAVRDFLAARAAESDLRRVIDSGSGYDRDLWRSLTGELQLTGLAVPARYGGSDAGFVEMGIVFEEMGRRLVAAPYLSTVLATTALLGSGDEEACRDHLPRLIAGEPAAVAIDETDVDSRQPSTVTAAGRGGTVTLRGSKQFVIDGSFAALLVVAADGPDGKAVYLVEGEAAGLHRDRLASLDLTRTLSRLEFHDVPAVRLRASDPPALLARVLDVASVALACEQIGGASQALDDAVAYAKMRIQFGVPIGSFQAIKHMCADVLAAVESATSLARYGAWAASHDPSELALTAPMAKSHCSEVFVHAATTNIQVHGGIGFTWEHSAHLYYKRAKSSELLLGTPRYHRSLLADRLGI